MFSPCLLRYRLLALALSGTCLVQHAGVGLTQDARSGVKNAGYGVAKRASLSEDTALPARLHCAHLPHALKIHPRVISGGLPEGDAAFHELVELGIRTIISVDGMTPDVETARKYGLRYVHLPHGYDGVPAARVKELAKALRDLDGPFYVHCHHGKHRSPTAAVVGCVAARLVPSENAIGVLELAGTSKHYRGLYQSARRVQPLPDSELDALKVEFREVVEVPPMAEAMVRLGHTHHHLSLIAASNWRLPEDHPDLDPAHVVLLLREQFAEMQRMPEVQRQPEHFKQRLQESEEAARRLENALRDWKPSSTDAVAPTTISKQAKVIGDNCKACHLKYRDVPLNAAE